MANSLVTNQFIAREWIRLSRNANGFLQNVNRQYDSEFERSGAVAGQSIRIRQPVDYTVRRGPTAIVQNSVQNVVTLTVATQSGVDMSFSSVDRTMNIDHFSKNFIAPAVNVIIGDQAVSLMNVVEGGVSQWVANQDATTGAISAPNISTWLNAKARMIASAVPMTNFKVVMDPSTQANTVANLAGYFNSQATIAKQYDNGEMVHALGADWMADPTVILHTTGVYATTPAYTNTYGFALTTVAGAGQTGSTITCAALSGPLAQGDFITISNVFDVNPVNKTSRQRPKHFTLTAPAAAGATSLSIYPPLTPAVAGVTQQYQTVTASPANAAQMYCTAAPGLTYRKNIYYIPEAFTLASVDMIMPPNVDAAREVFDGTSVRVVTQYQANSDQLLTRLDLLFGVQSLKPEWAICVPDPVT